MTIERDVLLSLLKCTKTGPVSRQLLVKVTKVPAQVAEKTLAEFAQMSFFEEYNRIVEASSSQRVRMSIYALHLGADFQRTCSLLSWAEFESIAAQALETNGYRVIRNLHFKHKSKKWEIDVLGLRKPLILCVDCKHWRHGWRNAASLKAVEAQVKRTEALAEALPNYTERIKVKDWATATLVPVVLSLLPGPDKFCSRVPVVPILQLQDFINEVSIDVGFLRHIDKKLSRQTGKLTSFPQKNYGRLGLRP